MSLLESEGEMAATAQTSRSAVKTPAEAPTEQPTSSAEPDFSSPREVDFSSMNAAQEAAARNLGVHDPLPESLVSKMSGAEVRAVAEARGYPTLPFGNNSARAGFLRHQEADSSLSTKAETEAETRKSSEEK